MADFGALGDGITDDRAAIQAAFDAGPGTVELPPGDYLVATGEPILTTGGVHIVGFGGARLLLAEAAEDHCIVVRGADDVVVDNLTFEYLGSIKKQGIAIQNSSRVKIRGCTFRAFRRYGVSVAGWDDGGVYARCDDVTITGCLFEDIGTVGVNVFPKVTSSRVLITHNTFRRCGLNTADPDQDGIAVKPGQFVVGAVCAHNLIEACHSGISVSNWASLIVHDNVLVDTTDFGIAVNYTPHSIWPGAPFRSAIVARNHFLQSDLATARNSVAVNVVGTVTGAPGPLEIIDNVVDTVRSGVLLAITGRTDVVAIERNVLRGTAYPLRVTGTTAGSVTGLVVRGNDIVSGVAAGRVDLRANNAYFADNVLVGCDSVAVAPVNASQTVLVVGNVARNPRPISAPAAAFRLTAPGDYRFLGNRIEVGTKPLVAGVDVGAATKVQAADNRCIPFDLPTFSGPVISP